MSGLKERLRNTIAPLLRNRFVQQGRFVVPACVYFVASRLRPIRPGLIVIASDSRGELGGNLGWIRDEIARVRPDAEVTTFLKPRLRARRSVRDVLRMPVIFAAAELVLLDDYYPLIYALPLRKATTVAQLWHATGAMKRVGFSREGLDGGPIKGSNIHRGYGFVSVSSEDVRPCYAEAFRAPLSVVHALGVPRTDAFFQAELVAGARDRLAATLAASSADRLDPDLPVVLIAPTFRGRGQKTAGYPLDWLDDESLRDLASRANVLIKMHPFVRGLPSGWARAHGLIDVSTHREINELLMATDVLVTDYSSAVFEFALLRRPVVYFCPDLDEYTRVRDFYFPFDRYLIGPLTTTCEQMVARVGDALDSGIDDPARYDDFVRFFLGSCDGQSTPRVTAALLAPMTGSQGAA